MKNPIFCLFKTVLLPTSLDTTDHNYIIIIIMTDHNYNIIIIMTDHDNNIRLSFHAGAHIAQLQSLKFDEGKKLALLSFIETFVYSVALRAL